MNKKYSILTCILNDYEYVREPEEVDPDVEYVLVTDDPNLKSDIWTIKLIDPVLKELPIYCQVNYIKYHPFEYTTTGCCMFVDGSIQLKSAHNPMMLDFINSDAELLEVNNLCFQDIVDELRRWSYFKFYGGVSYSSLGYVLDLITADNPNNEFGYNSGRYNNGLIQTTMYACKNTASIRALNDVIWCMLTKREDRMTMGLVSYLVNKYMYQSDKIMLVRNNILFSRWMDYRMHRSDESQLHDFIENWNIYHPDNPNNCDPKTVSRIWYQNRERDISVYI